MNRTTRIVSRATPRVPHLARGRALRLAVPAFLLVLPLVLVLRAVAEDRWTSVGLEDRQTYAFAVDPATPTTLYAGTDGGVFKSTTSGTNWERPLRAHHRAAMS